MLGTALTFFLKKSSSRLLRESEVSGLKKWRRRRRRGLEGRAKRKERKSRD